ncbi:MAG: glycosyltransferase family 2 protein [Thermoprotei archaeon]
MIVSAELITFGVVSLVYIIQFYFFMISFLSIVFNFKERVWLNPKPRFDVPVAILFPVYKEKCESIRRTLMSILKQKYDKNLLRIIIIVEKNDEESDSCVSSACSVLTENGVEYEIVRRTNSRSSKAAALNDALLRVQEPVVVVYDADDDIIDPYQIGKGVSLIMSGFDAIGVKVLRVGKKLTQTLSYIDTFFWVNVSLPGITVVSGYPLLSGEGLFVSRKALEVIGGFPDTLTEDSMLTLEFAKHGLRIGLLNSVVHEPAPKSMLSLIKQRIRWHRGYAQCFVRTMKSSIPLSSKIVIGMSYTSPISLIIIAFSSIYVFVLIPLSAIYHVQLNLGIFLLSLFSILTSVSAPIYLIASKADIPRKESFPILLLYWVLLGLTTIYSLIMPKIPWYRTERT